MTMDVKLSPEQEELVRSVRGELSRHQSNFPAAGPSEADIGALRTLEAAGYLDVISEGGTAVDAALVVEQAAAVAPGAPVAARCLVAPLLTARDLPSTIALVERPHGTVVRFATEADAFVVLDGGDARFVLANEADVVAANTRWGYPVGRVSARGGESLGPGSGRELVTAWMIALAAEAGGLMEAATLHASQHVTDRYQFGKPIGSLQSIQHRLARAYVLAQGTKWLARRAAWDPTDRGAAAAAACYGASSLPHVLASAHQVCGAIGFTDEFGLTRFTARMAMLQAELGGSSAHAIALAHHRWDPSVATTK